MIISHVKIIDGNIKFISRVEHDISHSFAALAREISCSTFDINLVFPRTHVLFSIYFSFTSAGLGRKKG